MSPRSARITQGETTPAQSRTGQSYPSTVLCNQIQAIYFLAVLHVAGFPNPVVTLGVPRNVLSYLRQFWGSKSYTWSKVFHGGRDLVDKDVCLLLKKDYLQGRSIMDLTQEI